MDVLKKTSHLSHAEELYPDAAARPKLIGPDTGFRSPQSWRSETLGVKVIQTPLSIFHP
jgi:hypothetical protein